MKFYVLGLFSSFLLFSGSVIAAPPLKAQNQARASVITRDLIAEQPHLRMWEGKFLLANASHHFVIHGVSAEMQSRSIWSPVVMASYKRAPGPARAWVLDDDPHTLDMRLASSQHSSSKKPVPFKIEAVLPFVSEDGAQARLAVKFTTTSSSPSIPKRSATVDLVLGSTDESFLVSLDQDLPLYFRLSGAWAKQSLPLRIHGSSVLRVQMMSGSSSLGFVCPGQAANGWRGFMIDLRNEVRDEIRKQELVAIDRCSKDTARKLDPSASFEILSMLVSCQNNSVKTQ